LILPFDVVIARVRNTWGKWAGEMAKFMAPAQRRNKIPVSGAGVLKISGCVTSETWEYVTKIGRLVVGVQCDQFVTSPCSRTSKVYLRNEAARVRGGDHDDHCRECGQCEKN
jgi:hypothetical protein